LSNNHLNALALQYDAHSSIFSFLELFRITSFIQDAGTARDTGRQQDYLPLQQKSFTFAVIYLYNVMTFKRVGSYEQH